MCLVKKSRTKQNRTKHKFNSNTEWRNVLLLIKFYFDKIVLYVSG